MKRRKNIAFVFPLQKILPFFFGGGLGKLVRKNARKTPLQPRRIAFMRISRGILCGAWQNHLSRRKLHHADTYIIHHHTDVMSTPD